MQSDQIGAITFQLRSLVLFRSLLKHPVLSSLLELLDNWHKNEAKKVDLYCEFVAQVYQYGGDFGNILQNLLLECDNIPARTAAKGEEMPVYMQESLTAELVVFSEVCHFAGHLTILVNAYTPLPKFGCTCHNFAQQYTDMLLAAPTAGYGIFATSHMFTLQKNNKLHPVQNPDKQSLAELTGYAAERDMVLLNTKALLEGLPANNILLYGDAGTGKSSTVKAVANEFADKGLRLVEVRKNQLYQIPELLDSLADNPLKFILFIDDLSFDAQDNNFTELKAILEGNISARPANIVVYATSNRRHMVKERFSDRQGDDLHIADTLEETSSLAARFGITITFLRPDKELYTEIITALAKEYGIQQSGKELLVRAEAFALRNGGRSPRTARQFMKVELAAQQHSKAVK